MICGNHGMRCLVPAHVLHQLLGLRVFHKGSFHILPPPLPSVVLVAQGVRQIVADFHSIIALSDRGGHW